MNYNPGKILAAEEIKYILGTCHMIRFFDLRSWSFLKFGSMVLYKVCKTVAVGLNIRERKITWKENQS